MIFILFIYFYLFTNQSHSYYICSFLIFQNYIIIAYYSIITLLHYIHLNNPLVIDGLKFYYISLFLFNYLYSLIFLLISLLK